MTDRSLASVGEALLDAFGPPSQSDGPPSVEFIVSQDSMIDGVAVTLTDPSTDRPHLMHVSQNLASMLGYERDELLGRPLSALFAPDSQRGALEAIERQLEDQDQVEAAHALYHRKGVTVGVHATHSALPQVHSKVRYRLILFRDLSRRSSDHLLADQTLVVDSLARGRDLGSLCHDIASQVEERLGDKGRCWIGVTDLHDRLEAVVTGGEDLDLVGRCLRLIMGAGDPRTPRCVLVRNMPEELASVLLASGVKAMWAFPAVDSNKDQRGALVVAHVTEEIPSGEEVRALDQLSQVVASGIERATVEAVLTQRVLHDPLTQLPNRALIVDRLEQALARLDREPSTLSVLLVDIDRFKSINDSWGPDIGDLVLMEVADRLLGSVRIGDTVGRISNDQFLLICLGTGETDPSVVARRAISSLAEPIVLPGGQDLRITASIGVVAVEDVGQSAAMIIGNVESALARAVKSGRGRFALFDERLHYQTVIRHELEQALHYAILNDELVLHYQPVCEIKTGRMVGAEALVRWDRPGHGLLGPNDFIELAEETGLIVPLGAWVIDQAASDVADWPKASGLSPVVSVNLSARQLADDSLIPTVRAALERHDLPPVRLGFEVTESMRIDDFETAIDALDELSRLGSRIAIDDFGIGYATLDYLRRFSMADLIKVDRSFVAGITQSREDAAIVSASVALASSLGLLVVAEGVEQPAQIAMLRELGCHYAQGYALSAPVPLAAILQLWLSEYLFDPPPTPIVLDGARTGPAALSRRG